VPSCQWLGRGWRIKRRQIFNTVDGEFDSTVVISDIVADSDTEVELSFDRHADLLMEEETSVKGAIVSKSTTASPMGVMLLSKYLG
jgi:hypothetical protein